jgi:hypothetical protein
MAGPEHERTPIVDRPSPRGSRIGSLRGLLCGAGLLCSVALITGGTVARNQLVKAASSVPATAGNFDRQTLSTVSSVCILLGGLLLGVSMLTGAKLLSRPIERRRHRRDRLPPRANERPFADRLSHYLEEGPAPAVRISRNPYRSFFVMILPGPRRGRKPASLIREILMRIHTLLRGEK